MVGEILKEIETNVADPSWRLHRYPPKRIISLLKARLQELGHKTVSSVKPARAIHPDTIDSETSNRLREVNASLTL